MKTFEEWEGYTAEGIMDEFEVPTEEREGVEILLAFYDLEDYKGYAFVLFMKDGQLYEVTGCHCSCFGLEAQWEPEECTLNSLEFRLERGTVFDRFAKELWEIVIGLKMAEDLRRKSVGYWSGFLA